MMMKNTLPRFAFFSLLLLLFFTIPAKANLPRAFLKFHNLEIENSVKKDIQEKWTKFLNENPEVLLKPNKKYKIDQYCSFSFDLNAKTEEIEVNSIKLLKHKNNFDYNLKAIEFLKTNNFKLKKKNPEKLGEIEMFYRAF